MGPSADSVARAVVDTYVRLFGGVTGGWGERTPDAGGFGCPVPVAGFNGVRVDGTSASAAEAGRLLELALSRCATVSLQVRPGSGALGSALAATHGLTAEDPVPVLAVDLSTAGEGPGGGWRSEQLPATEVKEHLAVVEPVFGVPSGSWTALYSDLLATGVAHIHGIRVEGVLASTLLTARVGDAVGVFSVATAESHRGRGLAHDLVQQVMAASLRSGARFVWLQSTPLSHALYERLGFQTLERWPEWVRE